MELKKCRYIIMLRILGLVPLTGQFACRPTSDKIQYLPVYHEIDSYFLRYKNKLYISFHDKDRYKIVNADKTDKPMISSVNSLFHPFIFKNKLVALEDIGNRGYYYATDSAITKISGNAALDQLYSLNNGRFLIYTALNDPGIYLIDSVNMQKIKLATMQSRLHGAVYHQKSNKLYLSYDDTLKSVSPEGLDQVNVAGNFEGPKINLSVSGDNLYFCSNAYQDHYAVYQLHIVSGNDAPVLFYKTGHDLFLPVEAAQHLYFGEIINAEYTLNRIDLASRKPERLTRSGVVYDYDVADRHVYFSYSDLNTPKCLVDYEDDTRKFRHLTGKDNLINGFSFSRSDRTGSHVFEIKKKAVRRRGLVIFLHPGSQSNYSPRFDGLLNQLCANGYLIEALNFPGSAGYGRQYLETGYDQTVANVIENTKELKKKYNLPVFYLSVSSANPLMEALCDTTQIMSGAISLFGIPRTTMNRSCKIPALYILGEQDRLVNAGQRIQQIKETQNANFSFIAYPDEGHWFRKDGDLNSAVKAIICFMDTHR